MTMVDIPKIDADRLRHSFPDILGACRYFDIGMGWMMPVSQMCVALGKLPAGSVIVSEMSQKFGGLRVTLDEIRLSEEELAAARHAKVFAEERSRYCCEVCGHSGFISKPPENSSAWLYCLCHRHLPRERRGWPIDRRARRYQIGGVYWVYDDLLGRLRVDEQGHA